MTSATKDYRLFCSLVTLPQRQTLLGPVSGGRANPCATLIGRRKAAKAVLAGLGLDLHRIVRGESSLQRKPPLRVGNLSWHDIVFRAGPGQTNRCEFTFHLIFFDGFVSY